MSGSEIFIKSKDEPLQKARIHAMLCYRTPESLNDRFQNKYNQENSD
jgi:homoserine O-acetyltransferase